MRKHRSIFNRLTKKELIHLVERGSETQALEEFKKLRSYQTKVRDDELCWECREIAVKLGLE